MKEQRAFFAKKKKAKAKKEPLGCRLVSAAVAVIIVIIVTSWKEEFLAALLDPAAKTNSTSLNYTKMTMKRPPALDTDLLVILGDKVKTVESSLDNDMSLIAAGKVPVLIKDRTMKKSWY